MFSKWVQPRKARVVFLYSWNTVMVPLSIHFPKYTFYRGGNVGFLRVLFLGDKCDSRRRMFSKWVQPRKARVAFLDSWNTLMVPLSIHFPKFTVYHGANACLFEGGFLGKV